MQTVNVEAYRDLAAACHARAQERDEYLSRAINYEMESFERRCEIAAMLGVQLEDGCPPEWPVLITRLRECLTTYRLELIRI